jgi:hypothetical protein
VKRRKNEEKIGYLNKSQEMRDVQITTCGWFYFAAEALQTIPCTRNRISDNKKYNMLSHAMLAN